MLICCINYIYSNIMTVHVYSMDHKLLKRKGCVLCTTDELRKIRLRWFGQVACREEHNAVRKASRRPVGGERNRRLQKLRMSDVVRRDTEVAAVVEGTQRLRMSDVVRRDTEVADVVEGTQRLRMSDVVRRDTEVADVVEGTQRLRMSDVVRRNTEVAEVVEGTQWTGHYGGGGSLTRS